ncbi:protein RNA-directed DNA methylation 3-like [Rhododendron vialii]|uniref:protein RNA-directed DNA methylation 3-like n=1 Tax=Rhododendron vialii TaxID=182163 RepID=UPI00265DD3D0|nr:protein RNA-directed DNA methylation 3-like [Rhododendron vialii]
MTIIPWSKGKQVVGENSGAGKRKRVNHADKTSSSSGAAKKRKNSGGVLQFVEDAAYEVDEDEDTDDDSLSDEDFQEDEFTALVKFEDKPGKAHYFPFGYDEGELSGEELEKLVEERYKPSSSFLTYAEGEYEPRRLDAGLAVVTYEPGGLVADAIAPSSEDPTIWKVKCAVGRERLSAFCLMQKYVDFQSLGTKLNIISAFFVERVRGFIYIEAEREFDIVEACKGIFSVYSSCATPVPKNKVSRLLSMQSKCNDVSVGSWVRMKNGKYKGDLAEVIAVNEAREKATVRLIPRIDLRAVARKFGGGIASKKSATPAPRLINSTELEEFRPLIQYIRDRDTGQFFEVLDGMKLKDGYLYKKVSISSLMFWGLMPFEEELLKFKPNKKEDSDCQEWLSELYGEQEEKRIIKSQIGGSKGERSSTCTFEVHDPVLFNRKDFGVIVGTVEDDSFKILKEGSEGLDVVTVNQKHLKKGSFAKKFTTLDRCLKTISINDTVRVSEGPLQGRQGIVKQIFRGTIFLYDEIELENSGYICCKSQICEKIETGDDACNEKGDESSSAMVSGFLLSSKSPLSSKKPVQTRGNTSNSNRESKGGNFSIGQSLRIKVGPMKGYLCRVLAVYLSDITVKLDSHREILRVKCEHLSQVHGESSAVSLGEAAEPVQPIGLLGMKDSSRGRKLW